MKQLKPLPPALESEFTRYSKEARQARLGGDVEGAERAILAAWAVIPDPKLDYIHGQIMSGVIVEFYRDSAQFEKAQEWLQVATTSYGSEREAVIMLLRGTVAFEAGDLEQAAKVLGSLYSEYGSRPFVEMDPKYLKFIKSKMPKARR